MHPKAAFVAGLLFCVCAVPPSARAEESWILIDTTALTLTLMSGEAPATVFERIAIGQAGVSRNRVLNDQRTPLGSYRVREIREQSRFHRFIALDYPSLADARDALRSGLIDESAYARIRTAHEQGRQPPTDTPLGGDIGIHGIGNGDARFHEDYNWTDGCVALTNEQIDALTPWVRPGMTVVIR